MDTQKTAAGDDQKKSLSGDSSGAGVFPQAPKIPVMKIPGVPNNKVVEPPADLPFVDDVEDDNKPVASDSVSGVSPSLRSVPKIVPGVRGPLPSVPGSPMKSSSAKFGIGTSLRGSATGREIEKKPEVLKEKQVPGESRQSEKVDLKSAEINPNSVFIEKEDVASTVRPKISVPKAPIIPESATVKKSEELFNDGGGKDGAKITGKNIPPPSVPPPSSVDRNIRPRRLLIVVIVMLLFVGIIFMALWYFFTRNGNEASVSQPTESSLFSPSPTADAVVSPVPSADAFSQTDSDGDGLTDAQEIQLGTDPFKADTDNDGYTDKQEIDSGYDPLVKGGKLDSDRDGLADPDEKCWGTDLHNPDTDGDGYLDGQEVVNGYDPLIPSPGDKLTGPARCKI